MGWAENLPPEELMAESVFPEEGMALTTILVIRNMTDARTVYTEVLGAELILSRAQTAENSGKGLRRGTKAWLYSMTSLDWPSTRQWKDSSDCRFPWNSSQTG